MTTNAPADDRREMPEKEEVGAAGESPSAVPLARFQCDDCGAVAIGGGPKICCGTEMESIAVTDPAEPPALVDILGRVIGITGTELEICILLMEEGPMTVGEVADWMDCDNSYANRLLNHLTALSVVEEESRLLKAGGRVSLYRHAPIEDVEQAFKKELCTWTGEALRVLDEEIIAEKDRALASARALKDELDEDQIYHHD